MAELPVKDGEQLTRAQMREQDEKEEAFQQARRIALQILTLTRNGLFVSLRFMDVALCQFVYVSSDMVDLPFDIKTVATTGEHLVFDPRYIIRQYMREKKTLSRDYLHMVLHCIFRHPFVSTNMNREMWDLAADIAAEATICDLELNQTEVQDSSEIEYEIERIRGFVTQMNAEKIYRFLLTGDVTAKDINRWTKLFHRDEHDIWWEAARRIEEEKKKQAEEEAARDDQSGQEPDLQDEDENKENSEEEQQENPDAEDSDENPDDTDEEQEDQDEENEAPDDGSADEESEDSEEGDENDQSSDEESDEDQDGGDEDQDQSDEDEGGDDEPGYDEFEDEYVSSPGGDNENSDDPSQGDPNSQTQESDEESSGEGEGGGNPGDDPEQSDEEGSERDNDTKTDNLSGQDDGHQPKNDKNDESGNLDGETKEGAQDDTENPFGDKSQEGNQDPGGGAGMQKNEGSKSREHSAGSGGGGEGKQAAWQHEGGSERRSDGQRDENDMRRLDGSADPNSEQKELQGDNDSRQEAKPEQGTADQGEEPPEEKQPSFMHNGKEQEELENKWKEISERMLVDLETSSKEWGDKSDAMVQNLRKINRDKYDYRTFLQKFSTLREDIQINDDEFDYIYYTYGLEHYKDMPLIEPLEYKEVKKVRDFVIAIDTSGSCAGEVVQKFLDKTYSIFSQQENFFRKINLHIIQCDAAIQSDVKITNKEEFADYMKDLEFRGFGGTDFRPVFEYVNQLLEHNEFDDLKGLIYFTDGNGVYPKKRPPYETAFVFVDDDEFDYEVPSWAMKLVLETSDITEEVLI